MDMNSYLDQYEENALHILSGEKISLYEAKIIQAIYCLKEQRANVASQIAQYLNASKSSISIALRGMDKKALIKRVIDTEDHRRVYLEPTLKSKRIHEIYKEIHEDFIDKAFEILDDVQKKTLIHLSVILRNHMNSLVQ
jgi:DNA-binding MarR family transcriptional regulator